MRRAGVRSAAMTAAVVFGMSAWAPYGVAAPTAAAEPVDLGGEPVPCGSGCTDPNDPTRLTAGLWSDTLGPGTASAHHFTYDRTMDLSTVHVGVIGTSSDPAGDSVGVTVWAGDVECASDSDSPNSSVVHGVFGAAVEVGPDDPGGRDGNCLVGTLRITVDREFSSSEEDLPVAIKIVEEGPVRLADPSNPDLPLPDDEIRYRVPDGSAAEQREGSTSLQDAPLLDKVAGGVTVSITIPEGEERLYRVPVGWGQQVVAAADVPAVRDEEFTGSPTVALRIVEPTRNTLADPAADESSYGDYGPEPLSLSMGTRRLRYLNREAGVSPTLPGDYWVAVAVERVGETEERDPVDVPIDLTIAVTGDDGEGAPPYQKTVQSPDGGAGPSGYSPETPYLVGDGRFAAVASGNPVSPETGGDSWWDPRRFTGLGLGAVSLACCAVGAIWLARRRPR